MIPAGNRFDYEVPELAAAAIEVGSRVRVPVRTRTVVGTVIALSDETEASGVKPIHQVVAGEPVLTPAAAPAGGVDGRLLLLHAGGRAPLGAAAGDPPRRCRAEAPALCARSCARLRPKELEQLRKRAPLQAGVLDFLSGATEPVAVSKLAAECDAHHAVIQALQKKGFLSVAVADGRARSV